MEGTFLLIVDRLDRVKEQEPIATPSYILNQRLCIPF